MKILIIDDNDLLRRAAARFLRAKGHEAHEAVDGVEGLRLAIELQPDRIICDFEMPGLDGRQVYDRLPADLQSRLFLWSGAPPDPFPRPVIEKPCNVFEMIEIAGIV